MALTQKQIDEQKKQVEEMLGPDLDRLGFAKSLFFGRFKGDVLFRTRSCRRSSRRRPTTWPRR